VEEVFGVAGVESSADHQGPVTIGVKVRWRDVGKGQRGPSGECGDLETNGKVFAECESGEIKHRVLCRGARGGGDRGGSRNRKSAEDKAKCREVNGVMDVATDWKGEDRCDQCKDRFVGGREQACKCEFSQPKGGGGQGDERSRRVDGGYPRGASESRERRRRRSRKLGCGRAGGRGRPAMATQ
jgi:hypothetical protein